MDGYCVDGALYLHRVAAATGRTNADGDSREQPGSESLAAYRSRLWWLGNIDRLHPLERKVSEDAREIMAVTDEIENALRERSPGHRGDRIAGEGIAWQRECS